jgi:fructokinase
MGAFGPCDPDPASPTFGWITTTPKPGWRDVDVLGMLQGRLGGVPMAFDTDVNVAALGELVHGAGRGLRSLVYLTIGTGIGGGAVLDGRLVHGLVHPEMGHMRIPRPEAERASFAGVCPYHGDCFEGVGSGPALAARWGSPAQDIVPTDPRYEAMWDLEADYLAATLHAIVCVLSPQRIVVGGGVGGQEHLLARTRPRLLDSLAGYIASPGILEQVDQYVVAPELGGRAGGIGALELASRALG